MAIELMIFASLFILLVGLIYAVVGSSDRTKRIQLHDVETARISSQPWDAHKVGRRGNR